MVKVLSNVEDIVGGFFNYGKKIRIINTIDKLCKNDFWKISTK